MGFYYKKGLRGNASPVLKSVIIDNSDDIAIGDMVKVYNAGNAEKATAGVAIFGVVHSIVDKYGLGIKPELTTKATTGTATVASGRTGAVTVASDNETVDEIAVMVDCSPFTIYSGDVTGTINTTNTSAKQGAYIDIADEANINETTAIRSGVAQLYGWGTDPDDSGNLLVSICESELVNPIFS